MNHFQSLLDGLSEVDTTFWRDVETLQKNWFGKCDGVSFRFKLQVCISLHQYPRLINYRVPTRTGNLGKWEGLFQSGKSQGKSHKILENSNFTQVLFVIFSDI